MMPVALAVARPLLVRSFQQSLVRLGHRIAIDGDLGRFTLNAALSALKDGTIDEVAERLVRTFLEALEYEGLLVHEDRLEAYASPISYDENVPLQYLVYLVGKENLKVGSYYIIEYQGTFQGIGQFSKGAWNDVMPKEYRYDDMGIGTGLIACAKYYQYHFKRFVKDGYPPELFTIDVAYLMHNQGYGGVMRNVLTGQPLKRLYLSSKEYRGQSDVVRQLIADVNVAFSEARKENDNSGKMGPGEWT